MIVVDINLLIYAHNEATSLHAKARSWWETTLSTERHVGLPWASTFGFVRLVTHPRIMENPLSPADALAIVESWFTVPSVRPLDPGPQHLGIVQSLFEATGVAASLTTDTHLAALAIEHQGQLCSNDSDFARFPGLRWSNPLG